MPEKVDALFQAMVESLLKEYPNILVLRVRMPIVGDLTYTRNFISKIIRYDKVSIVSHSYLPLCTACMSMYVPVQQHVHVPVVRSRMEGLCRRMYTGTCTGRQWLVKFCILILRHALRSMPNILHACVEELSHAWRPALD